MRWCDEGVQWTPQSQYTHQPLNPLAVDPMPQAAQIHRHLAAAVERVARVFGVDQRQQRQFLFVRLCLRVRGIDAGAGDTRQFALPGQRQGFKGADPMLARLYGHIPDFF